MHPRLDHGLAMALRKQSSFDGGENLVIGERERGDVPTVQIIQVELGCGGHRVWHPSVVRLPLQSYMSSGLLPPAVGPIVVA